MKVKRSTQSKIVLPSKELEELFEYTSPNSLRKSLHHVFFNYLLEAERAKVYPENFQAIASDFYFLILFLQNAEDVLEDKNSS